MAEDEKVNAEFLQKTKEIERLLLRSMKIEERIAKLNTKIKEAEEAAKEPGPKGDSQGSVGSPQPHNNQAEVIADLKEQVAKELVKLANVNKKLNKGGRRRTRRGGAPPPLPKLTHAKVAEMQRTLDEQDGSESEVLDYLIALKSHHPGTFNTKELNRALVEAVKQRKKNQAFIADVRAIVFDFRMYANPQIEGGRRRTSRRTRKSRKTRRS